MQRLAKVWWVCVCVCMPGCWVFLPVGKGPSGKFLATSVTSEILVAYIILDIDGEIDGQGVLALAQSSTLL